MCLDLKGVAGEFGLYKKIVRSGKEREQKVSIKTTCAGGCSFLCVTMNYSFQHRTQLIPLSLLDFYYCFIIYIKGNLHQKECDSQTSTSGFYVCTFMSMKNTKFGLILAIDEVENNLKLLGANNHKWPRQPPERGGFYLV